MTIAGKGKELLPANKSWHYTQERTQKKEHRRKYNSLA